jgi:hypothetical protein
MIVKHLPITRRSVVLAQVQVGSNARHRLQPPDIPISLFAPALESAHEAIYSQDAGRRIAASREHPRISGAC